MSETPSVLLRCSLNGNSGAALLPFPSRNDIPNPKFGVYIKYIHIYVGMGGWGELAA